MRNVVCAVAMALLSGLPAIANEEEPIPTYDERVADGVDRFAKNRAEKLDPNDIPYFLTEGWVLNQVVVNPSTIIGWVSIHLDHMRRQGGSLIHQAGRELHIQHFGSTYRPASKGPVFGLGMVEVVTSSRDSRTVEKRQHIVRMVRAPSPPDEPEASGDRRGDYVLNLFYELRKQNPDLPLIEIVREIPFERLETKLENCEPAQNTLEKFWDLTFAPVKEADVSRYTGQVDVTYSAAAERSTYSGKPFGTGTPVDWAVEFVDALEPCWKRVEGDFSVDLD